MDRIIQSPGKYIQGANVIARLGDYLKPMANNWLVVGDKFVLGFAEETLRKSLTDAGLSVEIAPFGGECSQNEIDPTHRAAHSRLFIPMPVSLTVICCCRITRIWLLSIRVYTGRAGAGGAML